MSDTYKLKMNIFENVQPEELLALLKNFNNSIDGNDNTIIYWHHNFLRMMLKVEILRNFNELAIQNNRTQNAHLKEFQDSLTQPPPL